MYSGGRLENQNETPSRTLPGFSGAEVLSRLETSSNDLEDQDKKKELKSFFNC